MSHGHDDSQNSIFKIALNLTITCFISGVIIAGTFAITEPSAQAQRVKAKNDAMPAKVEAARKATKESLGDVGEDSLKTVGIQLTLAEYKALMLLNLLPFYFLWRINW